MNKGLIHEVMNRVSLENKLILQDLIKNPAELVETNFLNLLKGLMIVMLDELEEE